MNRQKNQQLTQLSNFLKEKKQQKIESLLNQQREDNQQKKPDPVGFKNLSVESLDASLTAILNKGPSFVNAEPKLFPKLCVTSRASLQLAADKLKEQNVPENAISEFKGGLARIIDT